EDHLRGIYAAVSSKNPQLASRVVAATSKKPVVSWMEVGIGETMGDKYALDLSMEEAKEILDCLIEVEKERGYSAKFGYFQINFLVVLWRGFLRAIEERDMPKLPDSDRA